MTLYMAVTPDEYELPIFVESNIEKLSKLTGSRPSSIRSMASRNNRGIIKHKRSKAKYRFYSVNV